MSIGNELIGNIEKLLLFDVVNSKNIFRFSKGTRSSYAHIFESQISEMMDSRHVLMFPSASTALFAFLKSINLKQYDEVITSPFSWISDFSLLLFENVNLRFCALDENLQIEFSSMKKLINSHTKLIIIPHMMGRGQQSIKSIYEICQQNNIYLVEDIAQSFGVKVDGKYVGTYGDFSFCSLNHHKILSTGDGGFAIVKNTDLYQEICKIHDQGCLIKDGKRFINNSTYGKGLSLRVNNLTGAMALAQLTRFRQIKKIILNNYQQFASVTKRIKKLRLINPHRGDIPYTALIKLNKKLNYPSLLESGWHYIENVPYFKEVKINNEDKKNLLTTRRNLRKTYSIGMGFIDKYFSTPVGLKFGETISNDNLLKTINKIIL